MVLAVPTSLNGYVRNSVRKEQSSKACACLGIQQVPEKPLTNPYPAGLIDADGTIVTSASAASRPGACPGALSPSQLSVIPGNYGKAQRLIHPRGHNQGVIKFTNKYKHNVQLFLDYSGYGTLRQERDK